MTETETMNLPSEGELRAHRERAPVALLRAALRVTEHVLTGSMYSCPKSRRSIAAIVRSKAEELRHLLDAYELALTDYSQAREDKDDIPY